MNEPYEVQMCIDCAMYHANGELPEDASDVTIAAITHPRGLDSHYAISVGNDENPFSSTPCELCGSGLGGARINGYVMTFNTQENA